MAYTVFRLNHVHPDPSDGSEMSDRYRAALDMVEFLDKRGLNAVQFDEHHVSSTGWSPTPMMNAGMVLSRTENVLCMIGALLLPLHDPIRVAEDLAVLDLIDRKASGEETVVVAAADDDTGGTVVDLMAALEASVAEAKNARSRHPTAKAAAEESDEAPAKKSAAKKKTAAKKAPAKKKAAAKKSPKKTAAKKKAPAKKAS